jgi:hypothetical protein
MHGCGKDILDRCVKMVYSQMGCLLSACSHAGLVDEGICCYASVVTDYMISAKLEHHTCIVDLLDHAG